MHSPLRCMLLIASHVGFALALSGLVHAQAVSYPASAVDFGQMSVCPSGASAPAPCDTTKTLTYGVTAGGTLGVPKVLTVGAPNLDYSLTGTTCTGNHLAGTSCTVQVAFTPRYPGIRAGAVEIVDTNGNVLLTTFLNGAGSAPQITFPDAPQANLIDYTGTKVYPQAVTADGAGNVYLVSNDPKEQENDELIRVPAGCKTPGCETVLLTASGPNLFNGIALDGSGSLYLVMGQDLKVVRIPPGCTQSACLVPVGAGYYGPLAVTVDGSGNVYVGDAFGVFEVPPGCQASSCMASLTKYRNGVYSVAVDAGGTVFLEEGDQSFDGVRDISRLPPGYAFPDLLVGPIPAQGTIAIDASDDIFYIGAYQGLGDPNAGRIIEISAIDKSLTQLSSGDENIQGIALTAAGDLFYTKLANADHPGTTTTLNGIPFSQVPAHTFADAVLNGTSSDSPSTFTLQSSGNMPLILDSIAVGPAGFTAGSLAVNAPLCAKTGQTLPQGARCQVAFSFAPVSVGLQTGAAVITDNSLNVEGGKQSIQLKGTGVTTPPDTEVDFSNGFANATSANLALHGSAAIYGNALRLTDGGLNEKSSVFSPNPVDASSFTTEFDFHLSGKTSLYPQADGFTFVIQGLSPDALGSAGGGLGYGPSSYNYAYFGPAIPNSVAIKFDLYNNRGEGPDSIGLLTNGYYPFSSSINLQTAGIDLHSGHSFHALLVGTAQGITVTLSDLSTKAVFSTLFPVDILRALGRPKGYVGFTAGTGGLSAVQDILNWQYTSTVATPPTCDPALPCFPDGFSNAKNLTLNGSAALVNGALQLTNATYQRSSAFFSTPVTIQNKEFVADFDFQLGSGSADGLTFVLQPDSPHALGAAGGGLGYGHDPVSYFDSPFIPDSVAIKFDLHNNSGEGSNSTGIYADGSPPTTPATDLTPSVINLHSGHTFHANVTNAGGVISWTIVDLTTFEFFVNQNYYDFVYYYPYDTAYAGFTGGTGALSTTITIMNWNFATY